MKYYLRKKERKTPCSLPSSSVYGIFQAIVLEWIAISFSRRSSRPRDVTRVPRIVDRRFTDWATRENFNRNCLKIQNNKTLDIHAANTFKIMMICLILTQPNCRNKTMQIVLWNGKYKPISSRPAVNTTSKILKSSQGLERLNLITLKMATYFNKDFGAEENLIGHGNLREDVS